jgi:hypothetical protein
MGNIQVVLESFAMDRFVKLLVEGRVLGIKSRLGKFKSTKDNPAINAVQEVIPFVRLIREIAIVIVYGLCALARLCARCNMNGRWGIGQRGHKPRVWKR